MKTIINKEQECQEEIVLKRRGGTVNSEAAVTG
jgi:hypothetical protein